MFLEAQGKQGELLMVSICKTRGLSQQEAREGRWRKHIWCPYNKLHFRNWNVWWNSNFPQGNKLPSSKKKKISYELWLSQIIVPAHSAAPSNSPHPPSQYNESDLRGLQSLDMTRPSQLIELGRKVDSIFTKDGQQTQKPTGLQLNVDSQKIHRILHHRDFRDVLTGSTSNSIYRNLRARRSQSFKHLTSYQLI